MSNLAKQTAKQRAHFTYMADIMHRLNWDLHNTIEMTGHIPEAWHDIAQKTPARQNLKVNLRVDEDVVRFFKSMGKGYGPRMCEVLKSYMHARLAGVIKGAETTNHFKAQEAQYDGEKPRFGDFARSMGHDWSDAPDGPEIAKARAVEHFQHRFAREGMPPDGMIRVE